MEVNNYNRRLAATRNQFSEATQELKENYDADVESLKDLHETREKNQKENYLKEKMSMEESAEKRLERYDKDLKEELQERTERYVKNLAEEKRSFNNDRQKQMDNYNQKLSSISKSFDTANEEKDKLHALYKDSIDKRHEEGLTAREKHFNDRLSEIQKDSVDKINDYRDLTNREKRELITDHANEKKKLVQDASIARNKDNSRHQLELQRIRDNSMQANETLKNNYESVNENLRITKNQEQEGQRENFEDLTNSIHERNTSALKELNRQNKAEKRELEKGFAQDRISLEKQTNKLINEGAADKVEDSRKALKAQHATQVAELHEAIEENNYNKNLVNERVARGHQEELKMKKAIFNNKIEDKDLEIRDLRESEVFKLQNKFQNFQEMSSKKERRLVTELEEQEILSREKQKVKLESQRADFGRQVNQINNANQRAVADFRDEMSKEQMRFIEKTKRTTHEDMEELKDDLQSTFSRKEDGLNKQLAMKELENKNVKEMYQKRLDNMRNKTNQELEELKRIQYDQKIEDEKATKRQLEIQRGEFDKTLNALRRDYDRRLNKAKTSNDIYVSKLTQRYEDQLMTERKNAKKELDRELGMAKDEYLRLLNKTNLEKQNIVHQYESKIDTLKQANLMASAVAEKRPSNS